MVQRIIIVNDDALFRRSLAFILEQAGYKVITASNAEDSLILAQSEQPVSTLLFIEMIVGSWLGLGIAWLGYKWGIPIFQKQSSFWLAGLRVAAFLFPALLIWPRDILQQPTQLLAAIGISALVISIPHFGQSFYFPGGSRLKDFCP